MSTRIGLAGMWTNARGAGIVNIRLYHALTELGYDVYVFGKTGFIGGQHPLPHALGVCPPSRFSPHLRYDVEPATLRSWATFNKLSAVVLAEEYDFALPHVLQQAGIKTIQWIDAYLAASWRPLLKLYDQLWCLCHRSQAILLDWGKAQQTHFVGWGVPQDLFIAPATAPATRMDFMHSGGWLGMDCRKGTDTLLSALSRMDNAQLLLHCQLPEADVKRLLGYADGFPPHIVYEDGDYPPPGLYHLGRVVVQPSKMEGFGLSIVEALCAGRPVITVDAAPMNEFVTPACGFFIPVEGWKPHVDGSVYQQALISPAALAKVMEDARATSDKGIAQRSEHARARAQDIFDWGAFKARIQDGLGRLDIHP